MVYITIYAVHVLGPMCEFLLNDERLLHPQLEVLLQLLYLLVAFLLLLVEPQVVDGAGDVSNRGEAAVHVLGESGF